MVTAGAPARRSPRYSWYVVAVLVLAYTFSYIDRQILTLLVQPIKVSLGISDVQVSLLHGLAFALFYTLLGIPIARLSDRRRRTTVIAAGIAIWSVMTAVCGLARTFGQMFAARVGVGVGEAALGPAAYSMIADCFPPRELPRALSVYTGAIYFGGGLATVAGGVLIGFVPTIRLGSFGTLAPWQAVFLIVGLPGLLIALLTLTLREPPRTGIVADADAMPDLGTVARHVWDRRGAYLLTIVGFSASSLTWNGVSSWLPTHFIRTFGWAPATVGLRYGLSLMVFGTAGIVFGGWLGSRWRERGAADANLRVGMLSAALVMPFGVAAPLLPGAGLSLAAYCLFIASGAMPYGCAAAALQEITPNRMRAQITAAYFLGLNLAGIGLGPMVVAFFTDRAFADEAMVRYSLAATALVGAPLGLLLLALARRPYRRALAS